METKQNRMIQQEEHLNDALQAKWRNLFSQLSAYPSAVVAYSGGVDSSFLAYATHLALSERMLAITIQSGLESQEQMSFATEFAQQTGFPHKTLRYEALQNPDIARNPVERCYHCKRAILGLLHAYAQENGFAVVLEGQNVDDGFDYRPGRKAVIETHTLSPLAEQGLSKDEIRLLARHLGLSVWERPSSPCLASRIPYDMPISAQALERIASGEAFLRGKGITEVRVRYHQDMALIEVAAPQIQTLIDLRPEVVSFFKGLGFQNVVVDLQGYRTGSMNEGLKP